MRSPLPAVTHKAVSWQRFWVPLWLADLGLDLLRPPRSAEHQCRRCAFKPAV